MRRALYVLTSLLLASPAFAQFGIPSVVLAPQNLAKNSLAAIRTKAMSDQLLVVSERLPGMNRYRIPGLEQPPVYVPRTVPGLISWYEREGRQVLAAHLPGALKDPVMAWIDVIDERIWRSKYRVHHRRRMEDIIGPVIDVLAHDI